MEPIYPVVLKTSMSKVIIPQLRELESADLPGMSSKILSSGCFEIFIGKGIRRHHQ